MEEKKTREARERELKAKEREREARDREQPSPTVYKPDVPVNTTYTVSSSYVYGKPVYTMQLVGAV